MKLTLAVALVALAVASPAHAVNCRAWMRMGDDQRAATVDRMTQRVVTSHAAQQYSVSKSRVARCLEGYGYDIQDDFDDACSDRSTASMQALNNIFNKYTWTCVR